MEVCTLYRRIDKLKLADLWTHERIKHQYVKGVVGVCLNVLGSSVIDYFRLESFKQDKWHHSPAPADGAVWSYIEDPMYIILYVFNPQRAVWEGSHAEKCESVSLMESCPKCKYHYSIICANKEVKRIHRG